MNKNQDLIEKLDKIIENDVEIYSLGRVREYWSGIKLNESQKIRKQLKPLYVPSIIGGLDSYYEILNEPSNKSVDNYAEESEVNLEQLNTEIGGIKKKLGICLIVSFLLVICPGLIPFSGLLRIVGLAGIIVSLVFGFKKLKPLNEKHRNSKEKYDTLNVSKTKNIFDGYEAEKQRAISALEDYADYYKGFYNKHIIMVENRFNTKLNELTAQINKAKANIRQINVLSLNDIDYASDVKKLLESNQADSLQTALYIVKEKESSGDGSRMHDYQKQTLVNLALIC